MKRAGWMILLVVVLLGIAAAVYYYFHVEKNRHELILYGNVDVRQVDIGFRVAGRVESMPFQEGDVVKEGDLMATLNITPYLSQAKQSEANIASAKATFLNAQTLLQRREELKEIGGVSQEDIDDASRNLETARANLEAAEAAFIGALDNLSYTKAFAPTNGVILTRIREPGTVVNPADPVYTLSVSCPIWVRAFVNEPQLGLVRFGMEAEVSTDTKEAPVYIGRVGFISPVAEFTPKTVETTNLRTDLVYRLRIYIDNPDAFLKQGMPVTVKLKLCNE